MEVFLVFSPDRVIPSLRSRSSTIQFLVLVVVLVGGLHGLHQGQSSTAFGETDHRFPVATAEQNVDIPVLRGAPFGFHQDPLPVGGSFDLPDTANQGFFRTFPPPEKCEDPAHPGVGAEFSSWPP